MLNFKKFKVLQTRHDGGSSARLRGVGSERQGGKKRQKAVLKDFLSWGYRESYA